MTFSQQFLHKTLRKHANENEKKKNKNYIIDVVHAYNQLSNENKFIIDYDKKNDYPLKKQAHSITGL